MKTTVIMLAIMCAPIFCLALQQSTVTQQAREELRRWRLNTPLDHFKAVHCKFDRAGVDLYAYNLSFRDDFSDAEIERGFQIARALGAKAITASSNVATARRVDAYAKRYRMRVGLHNHSKRSRIVTLHIKDRKHDQGPN